MTQLTHARPTTVPSTAPAGPEDFRTQIAATVAAHSALVARLAERLSEIDGVTSVNAGDGNLSSD